MRQTKRVPTTILSLMAIAAFCVLFAACGAQEQEPEAAPPTAPAPVTAPAPAPTAAPAAAAQPPAMPSSGTIPGSVLTMAMESIGDTIVETRGDPMDGCRPGCLLIKDDF